MWLPIPPVGWQRCLGDQYYSVFEDITSSHINLAFSGNREYMGWGYWNNYWGGGENVRIRSSLLPIIMKQKIV